MRNLTAPKQYEDPRGSSFDAGCEGLVLYTPAGDPVRLHVGADGFLYVNGHPFGVQGMPPALHAPMHAIGGGDPVTPASIGALSTSAVGESVAPLVDGIVPSKYIAGLVQPAHHAESHAAGGDDAITPASIRAVADTDTRLTDKRAPLDHASQHAKGRPDAITPASIGAVPEDDVRLTNSRTPLSHNASHHKNGNDPLSWADVGAVDAETLTVRDRVPGGVPQLNDTGHIDVNLLPQFAMRPALHADTHAADGIDPVSPVSIGAADRSHAETHGLGAADAVRVDASQIVSGVLDVDRIPKSALGELVPVPTTEDMLTLTADDVQKDDTVQPQDTMLMYWVSDVSKLGTIDAFSLYNAGRAAAVPWSGVENKPSEYKPEAHANRHAHGGDDVITPVSIGAPTLEQHNNAAALAQKGVDDAESARVLAVAAQTTADKGVSDAAAANANAETRATKAEFTTLSATVDALAARLAAAVTSENIRSISGTVLAEGVGTLKFEPK